MFIFFTKITYPIQQLFKLVFDALKLSFVAYCRTVKHDLVTFVLFLEMQENGPCDLKIFKLFVLFSFEFENITVWYILYLIFNS